jgi:hypothetical protein
VERWFGDERLEGVEVHHHNANSWRASARLAAAPVEVAAPATSTRQGTSQGTGQRSQRRKKARQHAGR